MTSFFASKRLQDCPVPRDGKERRASNPNKTKRDEERVAL
jgi:hypothetical protein